MYHYHGKDGQFCKGGKVKIAGRELQLLTKVGVGLANSSLWVGQSKGSLPPEDIVDETLTLRRKCYLNILLLIVDAGG